MKTILFYGNCHSSVLGKWLHDNYSNRFKVIDCRECDVPEFHTTKVFATWAHSEEQQRNYLSSLHKKIEEVDYFVFQPIERSVIDELKTDFLVDNIVSGKSIALTNPRFFAYPLCLDSFRPFIKYVYDNIIQDKIAILDYLINEDDLQFHKIMLDSYESSIQENKRREEVLAKNCENKIHMSDFIETHWKNHLLFAKHNHPAGIYWHEVVRQLFCYLDEPYDKQKVSRIEYPNQTHTLDVTQLAFFRNALPNIAIQQKKKHMLPLKSNYDLIFPSNLEDLCLDRRSIY